jgi:hypothetical protein
MGIWILHNRQVDFEHCAWSKGTSKQRGTQRAHKNHYYVWGWLYEEREAEMPRGPTSPKTKEQSKN